MEPAALKSLQDILKKNSWKPRIALTLESIASRTRLTRAGWSASSVAAS